jgi:hypothetical protein
MAQGGGEMSCTFDAPHDDCPDVTHKIQSLEAENKRYREALKEIEKTAFSGTSESNERDCQHGSLKRTCKWCEVNDIAYEALRKSK